MTVMSSLVKLSHHLSRVLLCEQAKMGVKEFLSRNFASRNICSSAPPTSVVSVYSSIFFFMAILYQNMGCKRRNILRGDRINGTFAFAKYVGQ